MTVPGTIIVAILSILVGVAAGSIALTLLVQRTPEAFRLRPNSCALTLVGAACLLVVNGACSVIETIRLPLQRTEALARLQLILQEPLYALRFRVTGDAAFRNQPDSYALGLRFSGKTGWTFFSKVPASQLERVPTSSGQENIGTYILKWHAVIEAMATPEDRAAAGCLTLLNDFRQLDAMELHLFQIGPDDGPLPERVAIAPNDYTDLLLVSGAQAPGGVVARSDGDSKVNYLDDQTAASRVSMWGPPQDSGEEGRSLPLRIFAVGVLLITVAGFTIVRGETPIPTLTWTDVPRLYRDAVAPLWASGFSLLLVMGGVFLFDMELGQIRRVMYVFLGTGLLVSTIMISLVSYLGLNRTRKSVELVLASVGMALSVLFIVQHFNFYAFTLTSVQWAVTLALSYHSTILGPREYVEAPSSSKGSASAREITSPPRWTPLLQPNLAASLVDFLVADISWTVLIQLLRVKSSWSDDIMWATPSAFEGWALGSVCSLPVLILPLILVIANLYGGRISRAARSFPSPLGNAVANVFALSVFAILSFRSDQLAQRWSDTAAYHWAMFVAPAEDIRRGGWLLWDVPSCYGFLNIVVLAFLPTDNAWYSLYLVNSSAIFLSATVLFFVWRSLRASFLNWLLSFAVVTAAVFLLGGDVDNITGPQIWPMTSAFRFLWVYVLLAILFWDFHYANTKKRSQWILWLGCIAWLAGVLWSFESALYCTAVWLPPYAMLVWRHIRHLGQHSQPYATAIRAAAPWVFLPLLLLAVTLIALAGYYRIALGAWPDWMAFIEVAQATLTINDLASWYSTDVGLWSVLVVLCATATAAVSLLRHNPARSLGLVWAIWIALYSLSGYFFVSKTDMMTLLGYLSPIITLCTALVLSLTDRYGSREGTRLFKVACVPLLVVLLAVAFEKFPSLVDTVCRVQVGYEVLAQGFNVPDDGITELLKTADVRPGDPFIYFEDPLVMYGAPRVVKTNTPTTQPWLPVASWRQVVIGALGLLPPDHAEYHGPGGEQGLLPNDRMELYVKRATARRPGGGYILVRKKTKLNPGYKWFFEQLARTHTMVVVFDSADWELSRWQEVP